MTQTVSTDSALKRAVAKLGSQGAMARLCGVKQPSVWGWLHKMGQLPAEHVLKVEAATGISRHALRPDIYPVDLEQRVAGEPEGLAGGMPAAGSHLSNAAGTSRPLPSRGAAA